MNVNLSKAGVLTSGIEAINENLLLTIPRSSYTTTYCAYQFDMAENLTEGETYILQLWDVDVSHSEKTEAQTGVWVYWGGGNIHLFNWAGTTYFTNGHADYLSKTFTITSSQASGTGATNLFLNIYNSVGYVAGTMSMHIGKWKLEKGSVPMIWTPYEANDIPQGLIEGSPIMRIFENHIEANEFIEI